MKTYMNRKIRGAFEPILVEDCEPIALSAELIKELEQQALQTEDAPLGTLGVTAIGDAIIFFFN